MDVLVTGGAGFIGGHIAERLVSEGHQVTVIDNLEPYYDLGIKEHAIDVSKEAAASGSGRYSFIEGTITDDSLVASVLEEADIVYHQAAQAGVRASVEEPVRVNQYNVDGTITLLEAARNADIERFVFASSSSVYGKPDYLPYDEAHPTEPVSPYGVSKLAAEHYTRVYAEVYGLPTVSLRYFTVYGPRMRPNMAMTNFVSRCLHGESPVIYGDGSQTRDFTYIDDILRVNERLLTDARADGDVMNLGSTDTIDILTLAEVIRDAIDPSLEIEFTDERTGDAEHTHASVDKARTLVDYEPTIDIREGVSRFIDWYRENEEWYDPLVRAS